jgi:hypothetical protein
MKIKVLNEDLITAAYMTAIWVRCKRMPDLKKVLNDLEKTQAKSKKRSNKKKMSGKAMLNTVKSLNAALGGTTY